MRSILSASKTPAQRGLTLVEMLVTGLLVLLLIGFFLQVLRPTAQATMSKTARSEANLLGSSALGRIVRQFERSSTAGISLVSDESGTIVGLHPLERIDADGSQVWADHLVTIRPFEDRLLLGETRSQSVGEVLSVSKATRVDEGLLRAAAQNSDRDKTLATNVKSFLVEYSVGDQGVPQQPLCIKLVLKAGGADNAPDRVFERKVYLRLGAS